MKTTRKFSPEASVFSVNINGHQQSMKIGEKRMGIEEKREGIKQLSRRPKEQMD